MVQLKLSNQVKGPEKLKMPDLIMRLGTHQPPSVEWSEICLLPPDAQYILRFEKSPSLCESIAPVSLLLLLLPALASSFSHLGLKELNYKWPWFVAA